MSANPYEASHTVAQAQVLPGGSGLIRNGDQLMVAYDVFVEDMISYSLWHNAQSTSAKRARLVNRLLVAACVLAGSIAIGWTLSGDSWIVVIMGAVVAVLYILIYQTTYRYKLRRAIEKMYAEGDNTAICGPWRVEISRARLSVFMPLVESHYVWRGVQRVERAEQAIYIYVSAVSAVIIPLRAFLSPGEADELLQALKRHMTT